MSTHSTIAVKMLSGTYQFVYCHSDGYPEHTGNMLLNHYNSQEQANALVALGDLSIVKEKLAPENGQVHNFDERAEGVTVAYHRDRDEPLKIEFCKSEQELQLAANNMDASYIYVYDCEQQRWLGKPIEGKTFNVMPIKETWF